MAHVWTTPQSEAWFALDRLPRLESAEVLSPSSGAFPIVSFLLTLCFCLFAFTTLIGMISFSEIAANRISQNRGFITFVRLLGVFITAFGVLCSMAGLNLGNLWAISDLGNILIVFANIPLLYLGSAYVFKATKHYKKDDQTPLHQKSLAHSVNIGMNVLTQKIINTPLTSRTIPIRFDRRRCFFHLFYVFIFLSYKQRYLIY